MNKSILFLIILLHFKVLFGKIKMYIYYPFSKEFSMKNPIILYPRLTKISSHYKKYDIEVPKSLHEKAPKKPNLEGFPYPLPQRKQDYTCFCEGENGVMWYGSTGGVTRFAENADRKDDIIMHFSARRDLLDNNVIALESDGNNGVWVLTEKGATHIKMVKMSMEEKAYLLTEETKKYVDRRGMVSQKRLAEVGNVASAVSYGHSDNDGTFTANFAIGEIFKYATLKKKLGAYAEETLKARESATRACEACLLLMYIPGRGNGFVARSYVTSAEPIPDDGLFYKKNGETAVCVSTTDSQNKKLVGKEVKADAPIPERLKKLYTSEGFSDTDIIYKGDTSSDEITNHYVHLLVAHEFLGREDPELDEIIKEAAKATMKHIIDGGYAMIEINGKPTTWAKWNLEYFNSYMGWADACLNAAELLMFLKVTMHVTGEKGLWEEEYNKLLNEYGYKELVTKHYDRFHQISLAGGLEDREEIMYGDHMLAVVSFWALTTLEKDPELNELYKEGFRTWRYSLAPEFNAGYDFLYFLSDPDNAKPDEERIRTWFYRFGATRLAAGVSLTDRIDYPQKIYRAGYREVSALPPNDEHFIAKYDRNPLEFKNEDSGGAHVVESCYPYTFAYWIGRYFGFIVEGE